MPNQPYLDPKKTKRDGLAFVGLSLTQKSKDGNLNSITHQTAFDLNEVIDRDYEYLMSSNDDGWLVGGGEPGPPKSYKLAAKDSSHVEIMRIGTYRHKIEVLPTAVVANPDTPPELEIRFDMEPWVPNKDELLTNMDAPLPINWCLRFIHNQLFKHFVFPSRFCPGPFHSTILRKADWRSSEHKKAYFEKCNAAIEKWRKEGPKALNDGGWDVDGSKLDNPPEYTSGLWLFQDRDTITHFFSPNFLPPYNTIEKRKLILSFISDEWDEKELKFKKAEIPKTSVDNEASCYNIMSKEFSKLFK